MPTYVFRCRRHGAFEMRLRMADAVSAYPCPQCGEDAVRTYFVPMVTRTSPSVRKAIDAEQENRERPAIVHSVPPSQKNVPSITFNPKHYTLPRP